MADPPSREAADLDIRHSEAKGFECHRDTARKGSSCVLSLSATFLIVLTVVVIPVSRLIPPFQSPDEFNHIKRAYILSHGHVFLGVTDGSTGGGVDSGLLDYMSIFERIPASYQEKVTQSMLRDSMKIAWSGQARFSPLANTAVYFPLLYLPQAAAIVAGERVGLSINNTYYLARTLSLVATLALLWAAMRLYPVPLPVQALFAMPMVVFQLGSASLDAISFAMCVLVCALFMRAGNNLLRFSRLMHVALILCLFLLTTARTNLIGVIWLPLVLVWTRRSRLYLLSSSVLIVLSISWILFAALTVKGDQIQIQSISPASVLLYYLKHLDELASVIHTTTTSTELLLSYWRMFVGVLGWIDTPLDWAVYWMFAIALGLLAIVSAPTNLREIWSPERVCLALGAVVSTLLLFAIFLATFTLHPGNFVGAIQGRYFYPVAIFLAFAMFDGSIPPRRARIGNAIALLMIAASATSMAPKLIDRYWAS